MSETQIWYALGMATVMLPWWTLSYIHRNDSMYAMREALKEKP